MSRTEKIAAFVVLGAVVIVAVVAVVFLVSKKDDGTPSLFSVSGGDTFKSPSFTASLTMSVSPGKYSDCGSGGYSDIRTGTQIEIVNQRHEVLALGTLGKSTTGTCDFTASIKDIPAGEKMYGAKLGNANRGVIWQTEDEARTVGWALTLGD